MVKGFSIQQKRDVIELRLFCFTPHGKEKIVKVFFSLPMLEEFVAKIKENLEKIRGGEEKIFYVG